MCGVRTEQERVDYNMVAVVSDVYTLTITACDMSAVSIATDFVEDTQHTHTHLLLSCSTPGRKDGM